MTTGGEASHLERTAFLRKPFEILVVFFVTAIFLILSCDRLLSPYDEGLVLTAAMRVAAGELPHRDFYANYGPGQFFILAALFKYLGEAVLIERAWDLTVKSGIVCLAYLISARVSGRKTSIFVAAFCALWLSTVATPGYPFFPAIFFILLSVLLLLPGLQRPLGDAQLFGAGVCVGLAGAFRYDMWVLGGVADSLSLFLIATLSTEGRKHLTRRIFELVIPFYAGMIAIIAPIMAAYAYLGVLPDWTFQIIWFPTKNYPLMRSLPFPRPWASLIAVFESIVYIPLVVAALCFAGALYERAHRSADKSQTGWGAVMISIMALAMFLKGIVRVSPTHMIASLLLAFIALGYLYEMSTRREGFYGERIGSIFVFVTILMLFLPSSFAITHAGYLISGNIEAWLGSGPVCKPLIDSPRARCIQTTLATAETVNFIRSNTKNSDKIFVGNGRHDKIHENDNAIYFLSDRMPATKWSHFDPGLQTSAAIQMQMIGELKRVKPPMVVLDSEWDGVEEPNGSSVSSGVRLLDEYLKDNYLQIAKFDPYVILGPKQ